MTQTARDITEHGGQQLYVASFYHTRAAGRISIARRAPKGMDALPVYPRLAPGPWFKSTSQDEFRQLYYAEVLAPLDPLQTLVELQAIAYPYDPVLLCWEKLVTPEDWCHRQLVQEWLRDALGLHVPELCKGELPDDGAAHAMTRMDNAGLLAQPSLF